MATAADLHKKIQEKRDELFQKVESNLNALETRVTDLSTGFSFSRGDIVSNLPEINYLSTGFSDAENNTTYNDNTDQWAGVLKRGVIPSTSGSSGYGIASSGGGSISKDVLNKLRALATFTAQDVTVGPIVTTIQQILDDMQEDLRKYRPYWNETSKQLENIIDQIQTEPEKYKTRVFSASELDVFEQRILGVIRSGAYGFSEELQSALFNKDRNRKEHLLDEALRLAASTFAAKGFRIPTSALSKLENKVVEEYLTKDEDLNRKITESALAAAAEGIQTGISTEIAIDKIHSDFAIKLSSVFKNITGMLAKQYAIKSKVDIAVITAKMANYASRLNIQLGKLDLLVKESDIINKYNSVKVELLNSFRIDGYSLAAAMILEDYSLIAKAELTDFKNRSAIALERFNTDTKRIEVLLTKSKELLASAADFNRIYMQQYKNAIETQYLESKVLLEDDLRKAKLRIDTITSTADYFAETASGYGFIALGSSK